MLTLLKPISAGDAQAHHRPEFANAKENYYMEGERVRGHWQGQLAERWGLRGEVNVEQFAWLSQSQHPMTGEALICPQQAWDCFNPWSETVRTMEHWAGWNATFSALESVSLTAPVGDDNEGARCPRERACGSGLDGKVRTGKDRTRLLETVPRRHRDRFLEESWWAHQDSNLEPKHYEFSDIAVSL